jgi:hypothetical protein
MKYLQDNKKDNKYKMYLSITKFPTGLGKQMVKQMLYQMIHNINQKITTQKLLYKTYSS